MMITPVSPLHAFTLGMVCGAVAVAAAVHRSVAHNEGIDDRINSHRAAYLNGGRMAGTMAVPSAEDLAGCYRLLAFLEHSFVGSSIGGFEMDAAIRSLQAVLLFVTATRKED